MQIIDRTGNPQEINKGDKIKITIYDSYDKPITTMNSAAYEPQKVIEQAGQLGVIWGNREEFTPLSAFCMQNVTFKKLDK